MDIHKLAAQKREILGRKVKTLRTEGILPVNLYGKKIVSQALQVPMKDFITVYKEAGETGVINLSIAGKGKKDEVSVLVSNLQKDPTTENPIHADLRKVDLKEKIVAEVPIETIGESPCEKTGTGTAVQYIDEVEVEALPTDLPDKFEVDVSILTEVDQAIHLSELIYDKAKVSIKDDLEKIVIKVEPPQKIEEEAPKVAEEVISEGEPGVEKEAESEGETPTEDKKPSEA